MLTPDEERGLGEVEREGKLIPIFDASDAGGGRWMEERPENEEEATGFEEDKEEEEKTSFCAEANCCCWSMMRGGGVDRSEYLSADVFIEGYASYASEGDCDRKTGELRGEGGGGGERERGGESEYTTPTSLCSSPVSSERDGSDEKEEDALEEEAEEDEDEEDEGRMEMI